MNIILLSPHFPPNYAHFCHRLRDLGATVLGVADAPYDALSPEMRESLTEYYRVDDMHHYDALVRAVGYLTHKHGRIDRIESHNEYWLETEAALRTDFNVPGIKSDAIERVKRKSRMREIFLEAGVAVARGGLASTLSEAEAVAAACGYPLVAKPDIGVGAAGADKIHDHAGLVRFFQSSPPGRYVLEEFVEGLLCSFDGLANREGDIVFSTSHVFSQGILETVQQDTNIYYYSLRDIPPPLERAGRAAQRAFDIRERFFHIEFFRRYSDDEIVGLEVNMRPPGGFTTEMFNYANDIDVYLEWANIVVNDRFEATWSRPYHCMYVGRKDGHALRHSHADVLRRGGSRIVLHEPVQSAFVRALGDYAYIARDPHLEPLLELAHYALEAS